MIIVKNTVAYTGVWYHVSLFLLDFCYMFEGSIRHCTGLFNRYTSKVIPDWQRVIDSITNGIEICHSFFGILYRSIRY